MGVEGVNFQSAGQFSTHFIPGVYSRTEYIKSLGGGVSANNAVFVGESKGGEPGKIGWFYSPSEAKETLRDGPLLKAVLHAFSPGNDLTPQFIGAIRANKGTKAFRVMRNGATDILRIPAYDWGLHTNSIKMKLEEGSANGSYKLSFKFEGNEQIFDDVQRLSFRIRYTGTGTAAVMNITKTGITTTVTGGGTGDNLEIDFNSYKTIEDLVNYINDHPNYTCLIAAENSKNETAHLDSVANANIKTEYIAKSNLQAIIETIRGSAFTGKNDVQFISAAPSRVIPDLDTDWAYFSGGNNGSSSVMAYSDAIDILESEDVNMVATDTPDDAVHILLRNHCINMNSVEGRKERSFLVGGDLGEDVDEVLERARILGSKFGSIAYPGGYSYDVLDYSRKEYVSPVFYAAKLIGQEAALAINNPMTNKSVDFLSWEVDLKKGDIVKLIKGGVTVGGKSQDNRLATIRSLTTHQGPELQCCERSMMREAMYMARDLRNAYLTDIGKPGTDGSLTDVAATLRTKAIVWHKMGLIVRDDKENLTWGLIVRRVGSATFIEYHTYLTAPQNFFFITAFQHVYEGSDMAIAA
jgi:hypothetical protein